MIAHTKPNPLDCPICGHSSNFVFVSMHGRPIHECVEHACGHFFTPALQADQGICERDVVIERESDQDFSLYGERNERLLVRLRKLLPEITRPFRLLDFGAGNAHMSRTFKAKLGDSAEIYCFEPNENCHRLYARNGLVHIAALDSIPDGLDLIYMIEVIEHLEDPIAILRFLRSKLGETGKIFLSTPHGSRYERFTNAYETRSHLHFFTETSLNLALDKAGFTPIEFTFVSDMYPKPRGVVRTSVQTLRGWMFKYRSSISSVAKFVVGPDKAAVFQRSFHLVGATRPTGKSEA